MLTIFQTPKPPYQRHPGVFSVNFEDVYPAGKVPLFQLDGKDAISASENKTIKKYVFKGVFRTLSNI